MADSDELSVDEIEALYSQNDKVRHLPVSGELSLEDIEEIDRLPEAAPVKRGSRSKKDPTEDRSITGWCKLIHTFRESCTVPLHDEESRPRNKGAHYKIGDYWVCRECYTNELDKL